MRFIMEYITEQEQAFSRLPFFSFVRDGSIPPAQRFAFAPAAAPFIMAFADLNRYIIFEAKTNDPLQELLNIHSREDENHYWMYLDDLVTLGYDAQVGFTAALRFLWADERSKARQTCYGLSMLLARAGSAKLRLVIVEAIESSGAAALGACTVLAEEYAKSTGKRLRFFGREHESRESGHAMGTSDIESRLLAIELSPEETVTARELVDKVFQIIGEMMQELLTYALDARKQSVLSRGTMPLHSEGCHPA